MSISAPYNFVPLSKRIIHPEWAEQVSQDIPFRDGQDGEFRIKLTALSDIYVRNGQIPSPDKKNQDTSFFLAPDGRYCIPATSVKGMIRNVLEIATFSRMRQISDKRYAIRDLNLRAYRTQFTENDTRSKVCAGFLDISSDDWKIIPCSWASWRRRDIDPEFGNKRASAAQKYLDFIRDYGSIVKRADVTFINTKDKVDGKSVIPHWEATFRSDGQFEGVLVFTGQPQDYDPNNPKDKGKRREFFFYDAKEGEAFRVDDEKTTGIDENGEIVRKNQQDFRFVHDKNHGASGDFDAWENKLLNVRKTYFKNRIPVFYLKNNGKLRFGLAAMFRLAGTVSTGEALRNTDPDHAPDQGAEFSPDMADLIFGYATPKKSLRGRVQFSSCFAPENTAPCEEVMRILSNPKPSFFPAYLKQDQNLKDRDNYKTFLDSDALLNGWKRYPALVRQAASQDTGMESKTDMLNNRFQPLPEGTVFEGRVVYHNLRPVELGALIWSLSLRSPNHYCHSLGMAKPYGFGKVKVEIEGISVEEQNKLRDTFTDYVKTQLQEAGEEHCDRFEGIPQIHALMEMAKYKDCESYQSFDYMTPKECGKCKANPPSVLLPYSVKPIQKPAQNPETQTGGDDKSQVYIKQLKDNIHNQKNVIKLLKGIPAGPDAQKAVPEFRRMLKNEQWMKNKYSSAAGDVEKELKRLETPVDPAS